MRRGFAGAVALACLGCATDPRPGPRIAGATAVALPSNVLGALVAVRVSGADSVGVVFHVRGAVAGADSVAPCVAVAADSANVPVLGLLPGTAYVLRPLAYGGGARATGDSVAFTTDTLPGDLPKFAAGGSDPAPGFVVFASGKYGLAIDNTGRVVWYHRFPLGVGLDFQALANGRYVARPAPATLSGTGPLVEVDALGDSTGTLACAGGLPVRFHDALVGPDGSTWIMCDEVRTMDLTPYGGVAAAQVMGTDIQRIAPDGTVLFRWSPFDHFLITDLDSAARTGAAVNWTHGNALAFDDDGNLLVSFRSLSEITKIDVTSGDVLWRLGGLRNQFAFSGPAGAGFAGQHGLRLDGARGILILDNVGDPHESRAEHYDIDPVAHTATLTEAYGAVPPVVGMIGGSVQRLAGGHVLVSYGNGDRVEEYGPDGALVWELTGDPGYVFRAQRIASLYRPGVGTPR